MGKVDRITEAGVRIGLGVRSTALLETTGRTSGRSRVTPVTNGLDGDRFWIVSEQGAKADYVRNLLADPNVRVRVGGRWRRGVATVVDDDPQRRLQAIAARNPRTRINTRIVRRAGTEQIVLRVDLEPSAST